MLLWLAHYLSQYISGFRVVDYITLRTLLSILTALAFSFAMGPLLIRTLKFHHVGQYVREDGPKTHFSKGGTPTMGGVLIIGSILAAVLLWGRLSNRFVDVAMVTLIAFGFIGGVDDTLKILRGRSGGLRARRKFLLQSLAAVAVGAWLYTTVHSASETTFYLPFFKSVAIPLGGWYLLSCYLLLVGGSNGVNLTDGLDGLAIMPTVLIAGALGVFAYVSGNFKISGYLGMPYVPGVGELAVFCGALVGAGIGFLWFNTYPAQVFMGDIGSLALGAALGVVAFIVREEVVFFVMAGVFVMETVSVMLQVLSFRITGRRIFRMAPLHHHYELKGWPEPKVIVRFWIITLILVLIGLSSLKVR